MSAYAWRVAIAISMLVLAACAPVRIRESPAADAAQTARETRLRDFASWNITAHIAISDGKDGGSGELEWKQDGKSYDFTVHAPVTGKTWNLSGDEHRAELKGVSAETETGSNPEQLLRDRVGWDVPLAELGDWVRGLRAPGTKATVEYDEQNLPALIEQSGWKVEYRDWFTDRNPPLPRKVFATRGNARVRVAIENWALGSPDE